MENSSNASSILDTLRTVEFRLGIKGYNVDEVDEYLDRAAQEAEALQENLRQLNDRLRQASERISQLEKEKRSAPAPAAASAPEPVTAVAAAPAPAPSVEVASDETLQRTLILAQKFVDQIKRDSEAEAATTVAEAEQKARATVAAAEDEARKLRDESQAHVRDEVVRLEHTRNELAADVEGMARHLEAERNRLRDALTEILQWVDEHVQPANALMGVRPKGAEPTGASAGATNGGQEHIDAPTLNLQSVSNNSTPGASHQP